MNSVNVGRKGRGASWKPIDDIKENDLREKRILVFEDDVLLGRTMKRTVRELNKYSPEFTDLLMIWEHTIMSVKDYKKWRKDYDLPSPQEMWHNLVIVEENETPEGLEIKYMRSDDLEYYGREFTKKNNDWVSITTRRNAPEEVRKIMTLASDFNNNYNLKKWEDRLRKND